MPVRGSTEENYYRILELAPEATDLEIKKAYRSLALKHHPDRNQGCSLSKKRFQQIGEAYECLSDPDEKKAYDLECQYRQEHSQQQRSGYAYTPRAGPFDPFAQFDHHFGTDAFFRSAFNGMDDAFARRFGFSSGRPDSIASRTQVDPVTGQRVQLRTIHRRGNIIEEKFIHDKLIERRINGRLVDFDPAEYEQKDEDDFAARFAKQRQDFARNQKAKSQKVSPGNASSKKSVRFDPSASEKPAGSGASYRAAPRNRSTASYMAKKKKDDDDFAARFEKQRQEFARSQQQQSKKKEASNSSQRQPPPAPSAPPAASNETYTNEAGQKIRIQRFTTKNGMELEDKYVNDKLVESKVNGNVVAVH